MKSSLPLISCICVTNKRPSFLQQAINCFELQDYANKELVISYPKSDYLTRLYLSQYLVESKVTILSLERDDETSLGNARNDALYECNGDYICVWDDDDWCHPTRLSSQMQSVNLSIPKRQAGIINRIFLYDYTTSLSYLSFSYHWEGTLLCRKEILLQNQYSNRNKGEDTQVVPFLAKRNMLAAALDLPYLYIYTFHGGNTWSHDHFKIFMDKSILLNDEYQQKIHNLLIHPV